MLNRIRRILIRLDPTLRVPQIYSVDAEGNLYPCRRRRSRYLRRMGRGILAALTVAIAIPFLFLFAAFGVLGYAACLCWHLLRFLWLLLQLPYHVLRGEGEID